MMKIDNQGFILFINALKKMTKLTFALIFKACAESLGKDEEEVTVEDVYLYFREELFSPNPKGGYIPSSKNDLAKFFTTFYDGIMETKIGRELYVINTDDKVAFGKESTIGKMFELLDPFDPKGAWSLSFIEEKRGKLHLRFENDSSAENLLLAFDVETPPKGEKKSKREKTVKCTGYGDCKNKTKDPKGNKWNEGTDGWSCPACEERYDEEERLIEKSNSLKTIKCCEKGCKSETKAPAIDRWTVNKVGEDLNIEEWMCPSCTEKRVENKSEEKKHSKRSKSIVCPKCKSCSSKTPSEDGWKEVEDDYYDEKVWVCPDCLNPDDSGSDSDSEDTVNDDDTEEL
jgi:hypothetical protein